MKKINRLSNIDWDKVERFMFNTESTSFEDMMYDNKDIIHNQR